MARRVRVIGCGNPDAGDDTLGLVAVRSLRSRLPDGVDVREAGPATKVLDLLDDVDTVIVIDAIREPSGARVPGTVVRAEGDRLPAELRGSLSSHGLGLAESVALAAALGETPRVIFHGIEAADVGVGAPLSDVVAGAMPSLLDAIEADVAREVGA